MLAKDSISPELAALAAEYADKVNDICVIVTELVRVVGVHEDEDGLYYRIRGIGEEELLYSDLVPCTSLKPHLPPEDYDRIESTFVLNGVERVDALRITFEPGVGITYAAPKPETLIDATYGLPERNPEPGMLDG